MPRIKSLALVLVLALSLAPAHLASAQDDPPPPVVDGWGLRVDPEVSENNYLALSLAPGESFSGSLYLVNALDNPTTLEVLKVVGVTGQGGGLSLADPGAGFVDWIDFDRARYDLEPESFEIIPFNLTIPADATTFEYVGGFVAQIPDDLLPPLEGGIGIRIRERVGVPLIVTVGEPTTCALNLVDFESAYRESGDWVAIMRLMVSGDVRFRGSGHIEVKRPGAPEPVAAWDLEINYSAAGLPLFYPISAPEPIQPGRYSVTGALWSTDYEACGVTIDEQILITPAEYEQAESRRAELASYNPSTNPLAPILATDESGDLVLNLSPESVAAGIGILGAAGTVTALIGGMILWAVRPSRRKNNRR